MYKTCFAVKDNTKDIVSMKQLITRLFDERRVEHLAVRAGIGDKILVDMYKAVDDPINQYTLFDMASVTKLMATTTLSWIALDRGLFSLDDSVSKFFDCPNDKKNMTVKHLLTHTMGIGHKPLNLIGNTYENIQDYILQIPSDVPFGSKVLYSCPGFILLGKILEQLYGTRLDKAFDQWVARPLGLTSTRFRPGPQRNMVNANPTDDEKGVVNDYNCRFLGGICGNAGLFSNMEDVTKYVKFLLRHGEPLVSRELFDMAVKNYAPNSDEGRGLGCKFVNEGYKRAGILLPVGSIGHTGWTGQSVFVDVQSGLWAVILSDAKVCIRKHLTENDDVSGMFEEIHNAIATLLRE